MGFKVVMLLFTPPHFAELITSGRALATAAHDYGESRSFFVMLAASLYATLSTLAMVWLSVECHIAPHRIEEALSPIIPDLALLDTCE
jgi:hypothetical protein